MLDWLGDRLTYANAMASVAVFIGLGGSSYAAVMLTNSSVKSRHVAPGAIRGSDVWHPAWRPFPPTGHWQPRGDPYARPGFYKDVTGTVHLRGVLTTDANLAGVCFKNQFLTGAGVVFVLPPGFRPSHQADFLTMAGGSPGQVSVFSSGVVCRESRHHGGRVGLLRRDHLPSGGLSGKRSAVACGGPDALLPRAVGAPGETAERRPDGSRRISTGSASGTSAAASFD